MRRFAGSVVAAMIAAGALAATSASRGVRALAGDDEVEIRWRFDTARACTYLAKARVSLERRTGDTAPGQVQVEVEQTMRQTFGTADEKGRIPFWSTLTRVIVDATYGLSRLTFDSKKPEDSRKAGDARIKPFVGEIDKTGYSLLDPTRGVTFLPGGESGSGLLGNRRIKIGQSWTEERSVGIGDTRVVVKEKLTFRRIEPWAGRTRCAWLDVAFESAAISSDAAKNEDGSASAVASADSDGEIVFDLDAGILVRRRVRETLVVKTSFPKAKPGQAAPPPERTDERRFECVVELIGEQATRMPEKPKEPEKPGKDGKG